MVVACEFVWGGGGGGREGVDKEGEGEGCIGRRMVAQKHTCA